MGDNREVADETIAGFAARRTTIDVGDDRLTLWRVADLERYVDRDALLRAENPPEPPYWAHCWSGAAVLADAVPAEAGRVLEVGCGLGLPGVVAARRGADVVFVDREASPLAFVAATLVENGLGARGRVLADATRPAWGPIFDVVLAAEILYDRAVFADLARALAASVRKEGIVLLTDGHRIDTRDFYAAAIAA